MKVVHVIPKNVIGGVEVAANTMLDEEVQEFDFSVLFISKEGGLTNPITHLRLLKKLVKIKPDVVVSSLWWTSFVCIMYKILYRKSRLILFLHNQKRAHFLDYLLTKITAAFADSVFCDSAATKSASLEFINKKTVKVISFLHRKFSPSGDIKAYDSPVFIFWGRLSFAKGLDLSLYFFQSVLSQYPSAIFYIYGPDFGELKKLKALSESLGLSDNVHWKGQVDNSDIAEIASQANFFLLLSRHEGMAMAVVEAMQCGLIPIVTPVGEIPNYCYDLNNSIIHDDEVALLSKFNKVFSDKNKRYLVSLNARSKWDFYNLYRDDFISSIMQLSLKNESQ
ncbi:glycosyltransferase family 4 protein [Halomonas sp. M5N1S17]|uniref:glycosyltransferase family 4 protein n=1 Tax=Halomonas alkalisoli TaxID=2907158 RepID=UPI001F421457|nr:glycosyltransferase family 4 protein [Halomonas alkalisoli]MCE9665219.1 glycosyltransferase family 4 protein [Halomonas alkalisoli]